LDKDKFQAWFVDYPSGFPLEMIGTGIYQMFEALQHEYHFKEMHMVAHSMGGLVARDYLRQCALIDQCKYVRSYTSVASPYGGVKSAEKGIKMAPTVIPAWKDLAPGSPFLSQLFDTNFPDSVTFNLLFAFQRGRLVAVENSDGVITLSSQLRKQAQQQADFVYGFNQSHTSVLADPEFFEVLNRRIETEDLRN